MVNHFVELVEALLRVGNFFVLHVYDVGIFGCYERRLQLGVAAVGLALQNIHCQFEQLVALGGIDVRCRKHALLHLLDAASGHIEGVDAAHLGVVVQVVGFHRLYSAECEAVVVGEHIVELGDAATQQRIHGAVAAVLFPVAWCRGYDGDAGVLLYGGGKSAVALNHGR